MEKRKYTQQEVFDIMKKHGNSRLYYNKNDLNVFVKRPYGSLSYTMNLANKWSYIITVSIAAMINIVLYMAIN